MPPHRDALGPVQRAAHAAWVRRGRTGPGQIKLDGEDLSGLRFGGASLECVQIRRCRVDRFFVDLSCLDDADLSGCQGQDGALYLCRFDGMTARDLTLRKFNLSGSDFFRTRISGSTFDESGFERGKFIDSVVIRSSFRGCNLRDLLVSNTRFLECDFTGALLDHGEGQNGIFDRAIFLRCCFRGADFSGRKVVNSVFDGCDLQEAKAAPDPGKFKVATDSEQCPGCGEHALRWTRGVHHGNPCTPASDTEVEWRASCGFCGQSILERA